MAVKPKPNGKGSIGVGLPKGSTPFRIPNVKIKVIDISHLPAPIHVGVSLLLLPLSPPRSPNRGFLLRHADEHYTVFSFLNCGFQIRASQLFFILSFLELHQGNLMFLGKALDGILLADLAKRS